MTRLTSIFLLFLLATQTLAARLTLMNGDSLQGDLLGIEGNTLRWQSPMLGELSIPLSKVESFNSDTLVKIQGRDDACSIILVSEGEMHYSCSQSQGNKMDLLAVDQVEPFEQFYTQDLDISGSLSVAGVLSRGNKEEDDWDVSAKVGAEHGDYRHEADFKYDNTDKLLQSQQTEDYKLGYQLDWFFKERWFLYTDVTTEMLESKNIDQRHGLGLGVGYQWFKRQDLSLALESGLNLQNEEQTGSVNTEERLNWQWALQLNYRLPFSATLFHKHQLSYSMQLAEDWELDTETGLKVPLGYGLSSDVKFQYDFDNLPAEGAKRKDTRLTVGVAYQW